MKRLAKFLFITSLFISIFPTLIHAQQSSLYEPINIQQAYEKGTRSHDGNPGENYWVNSSEYNINVEVDPVTRIVTGSETIKYFNNSPDELTRLVIRLYQDFYKEGGVRDWQVDPKALHGGVEIKNLFVGGEKYSLNEEEGNVSRYGTTMVVDLKTPMEPNTAINLSLDWSFKIPWESRIRMGTYDSTSFFVGYWYPQMSVYDDIDGWDTHNYIGTQEFYNDISNFKVNITVPKNFLVWGAGVLQNPEEVLTQKFLERYNKAYISDEVINIVTAEDISEGNITKQNEMNTWKFTANEIPDFAFAMSDHYLWDGTSVVVDDKTGRKVFAAAAYKKESEDFYEVADIAAKTIKSLSAELPGIPFPYPELTVFNGHGGMEYPMMVNDGSAESRSGTVHVTSHEITHTYFPFYMGSNEVKYSWMDEAWATMIPCKLQTKLQPDYDPVFRIVQGYVNRAGLETELPPMISNEFMKYPAFRTAAYMRPGTAYEFLRDYLGDDLFKESFQVFIENWHGKHPIPFDFFYTFNKVAGEDLSWFWKPWFFEFGYPDLAIENVYSIGEEVKVVVGKIGNIPIPVNVEVTYEDGSKDVSYMNAGAWKKGNDKVEVTFKSGKKIREVELGSVWIPDAKTEDNKYIPE